MTMKCLLAPARFLLFSLMMFSGAGAQTSNSVIIENPGFEDDVLALGADTLGTPPSGWSLVSDPAGAIIPGVWRPRSTDYPGQAPEGVNVAFAFSDSSGEGGLVQVLDETFRSGPDYRLSVKVGGSNTYGFSGYRVQLLAGGVLLAEDDYTQEPAAGSFIPVTVNYAYDPEDAVLEGEPLEIRLLCVGYPVAGEADFDDVKLTWGYAIPIADPGGPYAVAPSSPLQLDGSGSRAADGETITQYEWDIDNDGAFGDIPGVVTPPEISANDLENVYGLALGPNTIRLRITDTAGKTSTVATTVFIDVATVTPGVDFLCDANADDDGDGRWQDSADGTPLGTELLLDNSPAVTRTAVTSLTQIRHAYDFPGGATGNQGGALLVNAGTTTPSSFETALNWDKQDMSLGIWFRPDNLDPSPANGQVLFESGSSSGLALLIRGNQLVLTSNAGSPQVSYDLAGDPSGLLLGGATAEFIHALVTFDASTREIELFVNGSSVGTAVTGSSDWTNGDAAAFGTMGGAGVGGLGNGQLNTQSFDGMIGLIRLYQNQILTPLQVSDNFHAVADRDRRPPFISSLSPRNGEIDVLTPADLVATFDEDVMPSGSGSVVIKNLDVPSGASDIILSLPDPRVVLDGKQMTIQLSEDLAYGTRYAVRISADAITDHATTPNPFGGFVDNTGWSFTTVEEDLTAPVVIDLKPGDNASRVPSLGISLVATFDDFLLMGSGNIVVKDLNDNSTTQTIAIGDASQVDLDGRVLTITPAMALIRGKTYAVRIADTALINSNGLAFAGIADDTTWNFTIDAPLFSDNFEAPDVTVAQSQGNTSGVVPTGWVGATQGYGANRRGVVDEAAGDFTDPAGQQAFAFRYTNSGVTTAQGAIGPLQAGVTYHVSFDVVEDRAGNLSGLPYDFALLTFSPGALRNDVRQMNQNAFSVLETRSGNAVAGGAYTTISFSFTADESHASSIGKDLALRFKGATASATIDNVSVTVDSEPDTIPPSLTGITDDRNGGSVEVGQAVIYTVSFNEDMDAGTIGASDFVNIGSASVSIGAVRETALGSGTFLVPVTPIGTGTLQLSIPAGSVLSDAFGNYLNTTNPTMDDAIITVNPSTRGYAGWVAGPFLGTLVNTNGEFDFDSGGLATGIEWVLGGDPTNAADDTAILPTLDATSDPDFVIFSYRRSDLAAADLATTIAVEYGSDMNFAQTANPGPDVVVEVQDDAVAAGVDLVHVKIRRTLAGPGRMFVRLNVVVTPP